MDALAFDLLDRFLTLNPKQRITAKEALEHPYFRAQPLACAPECLPKLQVDTHEYQARVMATNERLMKLQRKQRAERVEVPESHAMGGKRVAPSAGGAAVMEPATKVKAFDPHQQIK